MKRTISEVIELIKEKIDNCESNEFALHDAREMGLLNKTEKEKISELVGSKQAYTDVLSLLESSHLVEQEKAIEILKNKFVIKIYDWELTYCFISFCGKEDYESNGGIDVTANEYISKEEYKVLSGVLTDNE